MSKHNPPIWPEIVCILDAGEYKPGDPAPEGYIQWQEWARIQHKAGLRQKQSCPECHKWLFPQQQCPDHGDTS